MAVKRGVFRLSSKIVFEPIGGVVEEAAAVQLCCCSKSVGAVFGGESGLVSGAAASSHLSLDRFPPIDGEG